MLYSACGLARLLEAAETVSELSPRRFLMCNPSSTGLVTFSCAMQALEEITDPDFYTRFTYLVRQLEVLSLNIATEFENALS